MDPKIADILFDGIRTLDQAYRLDDELRIVQQETYIVKPNADGTIPPLGERIKNLVSTRTYAIFKELEDKKHINTASEDEMQLFFELVHNTIMKTPRFQIQIAIEPQDQMLNTIYAWLSKEIKSRFFLDIISKPQVLAGCSIVYRGIFRDYTMHTYLHDRKNEVFGPIMSKLTPYGSDPSSNK